MKETWYLLYGGRGDNDECTVEIIGPLSSYQEVIAAAKELIDDEFDLTEQKMYVMNHNHVFK